MCQEDETVDGIVLTHGHEDHTGAVDDLAEAYHCPVYMHSDDMILTDPKRQEEVLTDLCTVQLNHWKHVTKIGSFQSKSIHTPGHTEGSCCIQYKICLFTGDTLFASDIGRTDLFSGR
jgi:hydroxyacylglutathione hydrolase